MLNTLPLLAFQLAIAYWKRYSIKSGRWSDIVMQLDINNRSINFTIVLGSEQKVPFCCALANIEVFNMKPWKLGTLLTIVTSLNQHYLFLTNIFEMAEVDTPN